jgi:hypothetical protein
MKKIKALLGILSLASFSALTGAPALAGPVAVRGIVTKIDGERVTLKQPWGEEVTILVDTRRQNRPGMNPLVVGTDTAVLLDPKTDNPSVAIKVCTCVVEAPAYVAVTPIRVPEIGGPVNFTPRPPAPAPAPAPEAPPKVLFY